MKERGPFDFPIVFYLLLATASVEYEPIVFGL